MEDNRRLFEYYLNSRIFTSNFESGYKYAINRHSLELIIRPQCNQKCEYCYIYNFGDKLYPNKLDKETTLKNIDLILDYIYRKRKNYFFGIELFAGDMFYDGIFFDIFDLFYKYFLEIKENEPDIFNYRSTKFSIPCNMSFVLTHPEYKQKVRELRDKFYEEFNVKIEFSWSTDGLYAVDTREKNSMTQEDYDTIFEFCKEMYTGFHPMVAACNVKNWCQNYDWWREMYKKFEFDDCGQFQPMMLEVRNDDWTDEAIEDYTKFLEHLMKWRFELCNNSKEELAKHFFGPHGGKDSVLPRFEDYDPLYIPFENEKGRMDEGISCSMTQRVHFDCSALNLVCCHRLAYRQFVGAHFITNEEGTEIVDFKEHNINFYIAIKNHKAENFPICASCDLNDICIHGCLGAQYESSAEALFPCKTVCKLFHAKYHKVVELYKEYGIIDSAIEQGYIKTDSKMYTEICKLLGEEK